MNIIINKRNKGLLITLAGLDQQEAKLKHKAQALREDSSAVTVKNKVKGMNDVLVSHHMRRDTIAAQLGKAQQEVTALTQQHHHLPQADGQGPQHKAEIKRRDLQREVIAQLEQEQGELHTTVENCEKQLVDCEAQLLNLESLEITNQTAIQAELTQVNQHRIEVLTALDDVICAVYEQLRVNRAAGIGYFQHDMCSLCGLEIDLGNKEYFRGLAEDQLSQCPECDAILLRDSTKNVKDHNLL